MKAYLKLPCVAVMFPFMLSSCSQTGEESKPDVEKLKPQIQAMEDAFAAGEKAKDANAVAAYYSDDAVSYSRNQEPVSGKAAITQKIAARMAKDTANTSNIYKIVDLFAEGDMAVEIGSWSEANAAGEVANKGYYLSYFQKRNGKYICVRDMNVSTLPCKPNM